MRIALAMILLAAAGCEPDSPPPPPAEPSIPAADEVPSPWRSRDGSEVLAVTDERLAAALEAAIARARATADAAGRRWRATDPADRDRWAVKWAAPAAAGGVEHVWVRPTAWSAHRIEGRLASPPQRPLLCGAGPGDPVAFPAAELSDWLREGPEGREGGFTVEAGAAGAPGPRDAGSG